MAIPLSKTRADSVFFYTLAIFILGIPYNIGAWWVGTFSIILFLLTLINPSRKKSFKIILRERTFQVLFIFILFTYLSVLWSKSPVLFNGDLHTNIGRFKYYFLICPAVYLSNLSKNDINKIFIVIALAPALSIILYYTNHFGISNIFFQNKNSILSHYLIQNFFILFSILFLYIKVLSIIKLKKYNKLFIYIPLFLVACISLVIDKRTDSRLMDLIFILILAITPLYYLSKKLYIPLLIIIAATSSLLILNTNSFERGINSFSRAITKNVYKSSWGHRTGYILTGIEIFRKSPFIGNGINDISRLIGKVVKEKPEYFKGEYQRHFHNGHINILAAVGIFGYLLLIYFLILLFRLDIKDKNIYVFKNMTIIILFFAMMGEDYLTIKSPTNFLSILIALFITYKHIEHSKIQRH